MLSKAEFMFRVPAGNEGAEQVDKPVLHSETMYRELESSCGSDARWMVSRRGQSYYTWLLDLQKLQ